MVGIALQGFEQHVDGAAQVALAALFRRLAHHGIDSRIDPRVMLLDQFRPVCLFVQRQHLRLAHAAGGIGRQFGEQGMGLLVQAVDQAAVGQSQLDVARHAGRLRQLVHGLGQFHRRAAGVALELQHHGGGVGAAHLGAGRAAQRAFQVAHDGTGGGGVALLDERAHQVHMVGRIAELGVPGLGHHLLVGLFGAGHVAHGQRHVAQVAQAPHHVGRDGDGVLQHHLGFLVLALGAQGLGQQVVGGHELGIAGHQRLQHGLRFPVAAQQVDAAGLAQLGPAQRLGLDDGRIG